MPRSNRPERSAVDVEESAGGRLVLQPVQAAEEPVEAASESVHAESESARIWRLSIIASALSAILLMLAFQPLLGLVKGALVDSSRTAYTDFFDRFYFRAANASPNGILFDIYNLVFGAAAAILLVLILFALMNVSVAGRFIAGDTNHQPEGARIGTFVLGGPLRRNIVRLILVGVFGWFFVSNVMQIAGANISLQASAGFTRRMTALEPVLSAEEYKALDHEWAMVRGKRDYDALMTHMENISLIKHMSIPDRLI